MKIKHVFLPVAAAVLLSVGCSSDDDNGNGNGGAEGITGVFVANEGPFDQSFGTVTHFDPETQTATQDLFQSVNQTQVGNILQSIGVTPDHFLLVANNSGLVRITNENFELVKTIEDLESPRYTLQTGPGVVAITDWSSDAVHFYDETDWSSLGSVACNRGPDRMLLDPSNSMLWVINSGGFGTDSTVTRVNAASRTAIGDVVASGRPNSLVRDAGGHIWVLCGGTKDWNDPANNQAGVLIKFNREGDEQARFTFADPNPSPSRLAICPSGNTLYWLSDGGIFSMSISASELPSSPWVDGGFYGLGVDPSSGNVFASDAKDFASNGEVKVYSDNGQLSHTFAAGIIPGGFTFK
ncbi:MAG: hypothetical protein LAT54_07530 [Cryomorphaceae bacterium]|nr:hypothetical protein [Cryomorphaceae bacterium]